MTLRQEVDAFLQRHPDLARIELLASDLNGHFFSKWYPAKGLIDFAENGLSIPRAMYVLSGTSESMADAVGMGEDDGDPDTHVDIAPGTLSMVSWGEQPRAQALIHCRDDDVLVDPRRVLASVLDRYKERNLCPVVAFELEYTYFEIETQNGLRTVLNPHTGVEDTPTMMASSRLDDFEAMLNDTIAACASQNVETSTISAEYGAGQFEINFPHYDDALKAADHAQLFRRAVKTIARKHGKRASFMAKPSLDRAGNGQHIHVSILNDSNENIFDAGESASPVLMHAIGGLQQAAREAMLFWAPNINSYRRFEPSNCVPTGATWAHEHRHVGFRIPLAKGNAWRVENRIPGADANCYLTLATMLAAMLYGIENSIEPTEETVGAPDMDSSMLPLTMRDSIAATRQGDILHRYIDEAFVRLFANHREGELDLFEDYINQREVDWYA